MAIGIIGGTGLYTLAQSDGPGFREFTHNTTYGAAQLFELQLHGRTVYFLPRHGSPHRIPPHRINYRANIAALHELGCDHIIASNAVGSLRLNMAPGEFVLPDGYIDATRQRPTTFFDGGDEGVVHIDQTTPYCPKLRDAILQAGEGLSIHPHGVYICTEGPRFETPAEIGMYALWGADVVGMTGVPEVVLACELGISYATICVVTNYAAGISGQPLTGEEVVGMMNRRIDVIRSLIGDTVASFPQ